MISNRLLLRAEDAARLLSLLGNGKRFAILCLLANGEMSVGKIAEKVKLSQSALSQHLAKLRSEDVVQTRRSGQTIFYSCKSDEVERLLSVLDSLFAGVPR